MTAEGPGEAAVDFDAIAETYEDELDRGISVSGEDKDYFAIGRIRWVQRCLPDLRPRKVLDYGCGTGDATPLLRTTLGADHVVGVDTSAASIARAQRQALPGASFCALHELGAAGDFDLAYCNGVFHHIPPPERHAALRFVHDALVPGGWFALWENNPWNPGTRYVMSRIPFDRDAVVLSASETSCIARRAGFDVVGVDFLFLFPRILRVLRPLESAFSRLPFGAQYQVLCRKPLSATR